MNTGKTLFAQLMDAPGGLGIGVIRGAERGDEQLCGQHLAARPVDHFQRRAGVIDKQPLAGAYRYLASLGMTAVGMLPRALFRRTYTADCHPPPRGTRLWPTRPPSAAG